MKRDPIQDDVRRERWRQKVGPNPVCLLCRANRPEAMRRVPATDIPAWIWELHHLFGRRNHRTATVVLCFTCHAIVGEMNRANGVSMGTPASIPEQVVAALRALATFFPLVGTACNGYAEDLQRFVEALDKAYPGWRTVVGKQ